MPIVTTGDALADVATVTSDALRKFVRCRKFSPAWNRPLTSSAPSGADTKRFSG